MIGPCDECPWKKKSLRGYLGGNPIEDFVLPVTGDLTQICHSRGNHLLAEERDGTEWTPEKCRCVGRMLADLNDCRRYRDPELYQWQAKYTDDPVREEVFGFPSAQKFREHHEVYK